MIPNTKYVFNLKKANKVYQRVERALSIDTDETRKLGMTGLANNIIHWSSKHNTCVCDSVDDLAKLVYSGMRRTHVIYRARCVYCNARFALFHYWSVMYSNNKRALKQKPVSQDILPLIAPSIKDFIYMFNELSSLGYCYTSNTYTRGGIIRSRTLMCPTNHNCDRRLLLTKAKEMEALISV